MHPLSFRTWMVMLVVGATLPLLLLIAFALQLQREQQDEARSQLLRDRTTAAAHALGARLELAGGYLRVAATSREFAVANHRLVYDNAMQFLANQRLVAQVALFDGSGTALFWAKNDPSSQPPAAAVRGCRPQAQVSPTPPPRQVSTVKGAGVGEASLQVRISTSFPDEAGGSCELVALVPMQAFGTALRNEQWPAGWIAAVTDRSATILARSRAPDEFVGTTATSHLQHAIRTGYPTFFRGLSREGTPVMAFTTPIPGAGGWQVSVGVATEVLDGQIRATTGRLIAGAAAAILIGLAFALAVGKAIADDVRGISIGSDVHPADPGQAPRIREIRDVAAQLASFHQRLLDSARSQTAAIALLEGENRSRIAAEAVLKTTQLRLLDAQEAERRHLARELHDELGQELALLRMTMRSLESNLQAAGDDAAMLRDAIATVERLVAQVRSIAVELRPAQLDDLGLSAALKSMVRRAGEHARMQIDLVLPLDAPRLPGRCETALFRIAQAALTNAVRHSDSREIHIELQLSGDEAIVRVVDQGAGFDVNAVTDGLGVMIMRERAQALGGTVSIDSAPGQGTTIVARVPLKEMADADVQ